MPDVPNNKDQRAKSALERAIGAGLSPVPTTPALDAKAKIVLQGALDDAHAQAARDAARAKVLAIHCACFAALVIAVALRVTLLKPWPELGAMLITAACSVWTAAGFTPLAPVLAHAIAAMPPQQLDKLLSLRPPSKGNALSISPPPPSAAADTTPTTNTKEPPP